MCVPYGMWGLKTQQVKQSDRIVNLTRSARKGKNLFSRSRSQWKICGVYHQRRREAVYFPSTANTNKVQCIQTSRGFSGSVTTLPCLCVSDIFLTWQQSFLPQLLCFRETMLCNQCCGNGGLHTLRFRAHDMG